MKKTITTIIILILATFSVSAQVYRAGGISGFGTNTSYGARNGGGMGGSSSGGWFINAGGIYNSFSDNDLEVVKDLGGIGGMVEVGKGSHSIAIEYITHSYDIPSGNIGGIVNNKVDINQIRAYVKRRQYFMDFFYLHGGTGILNLSQKTEASGNGVSFSTDVSDTFLLINLGLGVDLNFGGGFGIFLETGVNAVNGSNIDGDIRMDGVRGGFKLLL